MLGTPPPPPLNAANKLPTVLSIINIALIRENYPFSYYHNPYMINYFGAGDHNHQADPDFSNQDVLTKTWKIKMALFPSKLGLSHVSKPQRNFWSRTLLYQYLHYEYICSVCLTLTAEVLNTKLRLRSNPLYSDRDKEIRPGHT